MSSYFNENREKKGHGLNPRHVYTGAAIIPASIRKAVDAARTEEGPTSELTFVFSNRMTRTTANKRIPVVRISGNTIKHYEI